MIYTRGGELITLVRLCEPGEAARLERRRHDAQDKAREALNMLWMARVESGDTFPVDLAMCRATNGWAEICDTADAITKGGSQ